MNTTALKHRAAFAARVIAEAAQLPQPIMTDAKEPEKPKKQKNDDRS
jgi:hypothetical protein